MSQQARLDQFRHRIASHTYFGSEKVDAILSYLQEYYSAVGRRRVPSGFKRNLLMALRAINEYARYSEIRFEDAIVVLHDFATNPDTAAAETNEIVADE